MGGQQIPGPYWVRIANDGEHLVTGRHGAIIRRYPPEHSAGADADCKALQRDYTRSQKALRDAATDLLEALERLAIFHQPTHPRHDALFEEYAEECISAEISYTSATLLDSLVRAANAAIAKARGQ